MNLNKLAKDITLAEGGEVNLSIAQVKEVLRITIDRLANYPLWEVVRLIEKARTQPKRRREL